MYKRKTLKIMATVAVTVAMAMPAYAGATVSVGYLPQTAPPAGDVDMDGNVTASDAAILMQRVMNEKATMPIEVVNSYMYIADADGDGELTASDSAEVMQKTLNSRVKLAGDKMTYAQWYTRKGSEALGKYVGEANKAATVFSAAQTYATDLYTQNKWQAGLNISADDLIAAKLLGNSDEYKKYYVHSINDANTPAIRNVEWSSENSPYGKRNFYPYEGGISDAAEKAWGWERPNILGESAEAARVYRAAYTRACDLYTMNIWKEDTKITVAELVSEKLLREMPDTDYEIVTDYDPYTPGIKCVKWTDAQGNAWCYPDDFGYADVYIHTVAQNDASSIFSAAQTYATDLYASGKWQDGREITVQELYDAGLLYVMPSMVDYSIITAESGPVITCVRWNDPSGYVYTYPKAYVQYSYSSKCTQK